MRETGKTHPHGEVIERTRGPQRNEGCQSFSCGGTCRTEKRHPPRGQRLTCRWSTVLAGFPPPPHPTPTTRYLISILHKRSKPRRPQQHCPAGDRRGRRQRSKNHRTHTGKHRGANHRGRSSPTSGLDRRHPLSKFQRNLHLLPRTSPKGGRPLGRLRSPLYRSKGDLICPPLDSLQALDRPYPGAARQVLTAAVLLLRRHATCTFPNRHPFAE